MNFASYMVLNKSKVLSTKTHFSNPSLWANIKDYIVLAVICWGSFVFSKKIQKPKNLTGNSATTQEGKYRPRRISAIPFQSQKAICKISVVWIRQWLHTCCWSEWLPKFPKGQISRTWLFVSIVCFKSKLALPCILYTECWLELPTPQSHSVLFLSSFILKWPLTFFSSESSSNTHMLCLSL